MGEKIKAALGRLAWNKRRTLIPSAEQGFEGANIESASLSDAPMALHAMPVENRVDFRQPCLFPVRTVPQRKKQAPQRPKGESLEAWENREHFDR